MAKAPGRIWLDQAKSDIVCAARVFDSADGSTYCHTLAKYQQGVEKSVKGVLAALRDAGIVVQGPSYSYGLDYEIAILKRLPSNKKSRVNDMVRLVTKFLDTNTRHDLKVVGGLAPRKPEAGEREARNTEYPFQQADGTWTAPAEPNVFSAAEVEEFRRIARRTYDWAADVALAASLGKRA